MSIYNNLQKEASGHTRAFNERFLRDIREHQEYREEELVLARAGCVLPIAGVHLKDEEGNEVWNQEEGGFLGDSQAPDTINPSLWNYRKGGKLAGVFTVVESGIYQVRGLDLANVTFIKGKTGWIILDAASTVEAAGAILSAAEEALKTDIRHNIRAIILSHTHFDHIGGIKGFVTEEQVGREAEGKIPIYAAHGFEEAASSENVYAGIAMNRRANYQFGRDIPAGVKGNVSSGVGAAVSKGTISYIKPTEYIKEDVTLLVDGLHVDFQLAPDTEAPVNMQNYFHEYRALWVADNCVGSLHNLYTMRGAQVRDGSAWAKALFDAWLRYGKEMKVVFQGHSWPHWNTIESPDAVKELLLNHGAAYQYIHDTTLYYANQGYQPNDIARKLKLPDKLAYQWYLRPYYGSVEMNAKGIYQKYLGYYNGNPTQIHPLGYAEEARKFVEYVGSEDLVVEKAGKDFEAGNYQWAAQAANYVVFANPQNERARFLCADALEQLGYQAESAIWRNAYLEGAYDLRKTALTTGKKKGGQKDLIRTMSTERKLHYLGIVLRNSEFLGQEWQLNIYVDSKDREEAFYIHIYYGAVLVHEGEVSGEEIPYVRTNGEGLAQLIDPCQELEPSLFQTDSYELLEKIHESVDSLEEYGEFAIVEPIKEENHHGKW